MAHLRHVLCQGDNAGSGNHQENDINPPRPLECRSCCHEVDSEEAARYREGEKDAKYTPSFGPTTSRTVACWSPLARHFMDVVVLREAVDTIQPPNGEPAAILWLPENLLLEILGMVLYGGSTFPTMYRLQMVCRRFYRLCQDQALWRRVDVANWGVRWLPHRDSTLLWLIDNRLPRTLRDINLNGWHCLTAQGLTHLLENCPQLEKLQLESCRTLGPTTLPLVMQHCRSLTSINLTDVHHSVVCGSHLSTLISTLGHRLTSLTLRNNKLCKFKALMDRICAHCPNLDMLDLGKSFGDRLVLDVNKWQTCLPRLSCLRMSLTCYTHVEVVDRSQYAPNGWPLLTVLHVAVLPGLDDDILNRMIAKSPDLRSLDIRGCSQLSLRAFGMLEFPRLRHVMLTEFSDSHRPGRHSMAVFLMRFGPQLRSLYLCDSSLCDGYLAQSLDPMLKKLRRNTGLRRLYLDYTDVDLPLLRLLVSASPSLATLDLRHCPLLPPSLAALHDARDKVADIRRRFAYLRYHPAAVEMGYEF